MAREAYKHIREGGRIILMSSNTASNFTVPKHSLYSASKAAVNAFVRCLAKDCGKKKITVNAVAPGGTVTDMFHETAKDYLPNADQLTKEQILDVGTTSFQLLLSGTKDADYVYRIDRGACVSFDAMWLPSGYRLRCLFLGCRPV